LASGALPGMKTSQRTPRVCAAAASAGNHGQAVAWAAREVGARARIFMPQDAPMAKVEATRNYGAETVLAGAGFDEALVEALESARQTGATFVHAFEDEAVIAGQGTIGLELADELPDVETFVIPIGGGGLASGIAIAVKSARPSVRVVGVEAEVLASAVASLQAGRVLTLDPALSIADGIAVKSPGVLTLELLREWVDDVVTVAEDDVAEAMVLLMEKAKLVVEGAGAVGAAALLGGQVAPAATGTTVVVLSGGNVDAGLLASVARRHETEAGRRLALLTRVSDRPGSLARLLTLIGETGANLVEVEHVREGLDLHVRETAVQLVLETRGREHARSVREALEAAGYEASDLR